MQDAERILAIYGERGTGGKLLEGVYRLLFNPELYLRAYGRLYKNAGAMTRGATEETVDGMSMAKIQGIIDSLRNERYRWTPVRRMLIPKGNGKMRPLGIPSWSDKLLQEVIRSLLDAYYEPQFSPNSHGFRPRRGCHTALGDVFFGWTGTKWFIEGDIKGCFDNIDHSVLLSILRERIRDNRFLALVEGLLGAGYLEQWTYRPTLSGTPQGGIVSPLLANIYMDRLDKYVEETIIPGSSRGTGRRKNREYTAIRRKITRLKARDEGHGDLPALRQELRETKCTDQFDPDYRRLRYIRYADDFLLGFAGPRDEAEEIKGQLRTFLHEQLKLELSPEKTLITHGLTEKARFLGYEISADGPGSSRKGYGHITLRIPVKKLEDKILGYTRDGEPIHRVELINESDHAIIEKYGSEYRGIVQYYAYARNRWWLNRLQWVMNNSLLKTLAAKHKSTVSKMARRFAGKAISKHGVMKCLNITVEREGRRSLSAHFGGISLRTEPFKGVTIEDEYLDRDHIVPRNELLTRLEASTCELCGSRYKVQAHHIRKLSDLKVKGQREKPTWLRTMAAMKRKTLIVCELCHTAIHAGKPTRTRGIHEESLEDRVTGEPCALKVASTVREGADGKGIVVGCHSLPLQKDK
jgi:group II intron reverse transcriptase/maturase